MREFEKKRKMKKFIYSKAVIVILLIILFILARGTIGVYLKSRESNNREQASAVMLSKLNERQEELEEDVAFLETRVGIEDQLRSHYSFAKEGEKVVIIIDEETEEVIEEEPKGFMEKTKSWFKGINLLK